MTVPNDTVKLTPLSPAARAAVNALDSFGAVDRNTVIRLLPMWARQSELTADDLRAVVAHYPVKL